jgi:type VII secretion protein EccB
MSWNACSLRRSPGSAELATHLLVGSAPSGGEALADRSLLVAITSGSSTKMWLLANGQRFAVGPAALAPLGLAAAKPTKVTNSLIDGIPPGPELAAPKVDERGSGGQYINAKGTNIGQLFEAAGQHYVLLRSGLAAVGPLMLKLLLAVDTRVTSIPANEATKNRSNTTPTFDPPGFPTELPPAAYTDAEPEMECVQAPTGAAAVTASAPDVVVYPRLTTPESIEQASARTGPDGVRLADRIAVPSGRAALVRTLPAPGDTTPNTTTYLVTDQGVRYALPRVDTGAVLASLGYGGLVPMPVPTFLLSLMPEGPALDPAAARLYVDETVTIPRPTPSRTAG